MSKLDLSGLEKIKFDRNAIQRIFDQMMNKVAKDISDEIDRKILYDLKNGIIDIEADDGKNRFNRP